MQRPRFGGRLSSLLDVRMREGNARDLAFAGGIGTVSSRFMAEGLIVKDKSSFILAGRRSYEALRDVFSAAEGMTIAAYVIRQRIGNVKEYMLYSRLPLTEIAYLTGYSSVFHLSAQFREITGMTPARFRQLQRPVAQA